MKLRKLLPGSCLVLGMALLLFLSLYFLLIPTGSAAYADPYSVTLENAEKTYDGSPLVLTPTVTGYTAAAKYAWYKNGVKVSAEKDLSVLHVPDSGTYRVEVTENDETCQAECTVTILPRPVEVENVSSTKCVYGDEPSYNGNLKSGTFAEGDKFEQLYICWDELPRAIGTYTLSGVITNPDYTGTVSPCTVTVAPKPIVVNISPVSSVYGEAFVTPEIQLDENSKMAFGEDFDVLSLTATEPESTDVGEYRLTAKSDNKNYLIITSETPYYHYEITKRPLTLTFTDDAPYMIVDDPVVPEYRVDGLLSGESVEISVAYKRNGQTDSGETIYSLDAPGRFTAVITMADPSGNYKAPEYTKEIVSGVYTVTSNGFILHSKTGFVGNEPTVSVTNEKPTHYKFLQSVDYMFKIDLKGSTSDETIEVWAPVDNEKIDYTIGIEKSGNKAEYLTCETKESYVVFAAPTKNNAFVVWKDDNSMPVATVAFILFVFLLAELGLLIGLLKKYRMRRDYAFAALPLSFSLFGGAGVYYFFAVAVVEFVVAIGLLFAILAVFTKYRKTLN